VSLIQNTCLSYFYASPNKVWEYILSGIPFLVSDLPEMRKLAIDEGMGLIVDHKSPKDIASKINFILDHPNIELYKQCKENCIKNGKNKYNWDLEKEKFIEIYQKLLNSKNEK
jgi:glycosyltransferase involved in cell wall biosynthesis